MRLPLGLQEIRPRTLVLSGILSVIIFALTVVPDPIAFLQILSGLAAIGSFILAYLNKSNASEGESTQEAAASGEGPNRVIQIMDSTVELSYPGTEETLSVDEDEPAEEETDRRG